MTITTILLLYWALPSLITGLFGIQWVKYWDRIPLESWANEGYILMTLACILYPIFWVLWVVFLLMDIFNKYPIPVKKILLYKVF